MLKEGTYKLNVTDNILFVEARGPFDEDVVKQFSQEAQSSAHQFNGRRWGSIVTYYGKGIFTPDAEEALISLTKHRVEHGMVANASILLETNHGDLQQMQLQRVYQACNVQFHTFCDKQSATDWMQTFLAKK
ncbi:hypothetical protein [Thalassotalea agarivorans]|uniref:SpoIIAA-like n=1 Tax=Thalassotalea agarivorans TaxID=349064 RepID=A0A1I0GMS3_THASX|nr:hypothetical protein [Thalassotalea agarivorans]SET72279.1 hypothetical protein SAMN05660429_02511 [Thalassotalea agarivorans]